MERICENRRRDGLHGLAIQWGPIGDVGAVVDIYDDNITRLKHLIMQSVPSWIYALDKFLQCPYPVLSSAIRIEEQFKTKTLEENIAKHLWSSLGVDPKTIPNHFTLEEIGIGSIVAVEFQQRLQRDYDINFSIEQIKKISVGDIKQFESGSKEFIKQYSHDSKIAKGNFSKIKFELSNEPFTKLNHVSTGKPIYVFLSVESIYHNLISLAKSLQFPVYGLNSTHEMSAFPSFQEITKL